MADAGIKYTVTLNDQATAAWNKFTGQIDSGVKRISGQFQQFGSIVAGAFSVFEIEKFVAASNKQELASAQLGAALKAVGQDGAGVQAQMESWAAAIQKTTMYADEDVIRLEAMLTSMTGLSGKGVEPLTKAVLDLSSGMGISTEMAARMVGKTQEGMEGLKRMGITIGETSSEGERLAKITEAISAKFGGLAEAAGATGAGKIAQFKNALNDLEETLGDVIKKALAPILPVLQSFLELMIKLPTPVIAAALSVGILTAAIAALNVTLLSNPITLTILGITGAVIGLTVAVTEYNKATEKEIAETKTYHDSLTKIKESYKDFNNDQIVFQTGLIVSAGKMKELNQSFTALGYVLKVHGDAQKVHVNTLNEERLAIKDLNDKLVGLTVGSKEYNEILYKVIVRQTNLDESFKKVNERIQDQVEWDKLKGKILSVDDAIKIFDGTLKRITLNDLNDELIRLNKKIGETPIGDPGLRKLKEEADQVAQSIKHVNEGLSSPMQLQPVDISPMKGSLDDLSKAISDTQTQINAEIIKSPMFEVLTARLAELQKKFDEAFETPLQKFQQSFQNITFLVQRGISIISGFVQQASQREIVDLEEKKRIAVEGIDLRLKNERLSAEERKKLEAEKFDLEKGFDEQIRARKREAFEKEKQGKAIESVINTAVAVTKALPDFVLAAFVGALGLAETSLIESQPTPAFAKGGTFIVPQGYPNDSYKFRAQSGERVTVETPQQQQTKGVGHSLTFNFNAPVTDEEMVWNSLVKRLRDTGLDITRLAVNQTSKLQIV